MIEFSSKEPKMSVWKLKEDSTNSNPNATSAKPAVTTEVPLQVDVENEDEDEYGILEDVPGYPLWKKVDRGDGMPYYFHTETQETAWEIPEQTIQMDT
jgi:hypothetical protein